MIDTAVVTIADVRALANRLCDAIEAKGLTAARLDAREYWSVYFEDMFDPREPKPVVGDVLDDLVDARSDLIEADDPPTIWHAAHHLAGLIQFIAYADFQGKLS